jgi:prepilin-type N-terminal cleavage/methylation domain-containing protein
VNNFLSKYLTSQKIRNNDGFSLIEILIVLGLIAVIITSFGRPTRSQQKIYQDYFRKLSLMSKQIKNRAQIERATYRMVFYMRDDAPVEITVEKSDRPVLLGSEKESEELFEDMFKQKLEEEGNTKDDKKEKEGEVKDFQLSERFKPESLDRPRGLKIKQIEISGLSEIFEPEGLAVFHYFSNGLVEETLIQVQTEDKRLKWSLLTDPLTGEIYALGGHKTLEEIKRP